MHYFVQPSQTLREDVLLLRPFVDEQIEVQSHWWLLQLVVPRTGKTDAPTNSDPEAHIANPNCVLKLHKRLEINKGQ